MANIKIAQLTNQTAISDGDLVIVETATSTNKMTVGKLKELIGIQEGGIVESGSGANGSYIKYADGTMICRKRVTSTVAVTVAWGSLFLSNDVNLGNFQSAFTEIPTVTVTIARSTGGFIDGIRETSGGFVGKVGVVRANATTDTFAFDIIAIGRWK